MFPKKILSWLIILMMVLFVSVQFVSAETFFVEYLDGIVDADEGDSWFEVFIGDELSEEAVVKLSGGAFVEIAYGSTALKFSKPGTYKLKDFVEAAQLAANMLHPHTGAIWRMTMSEKEPLRFTEVHVDGEPDMIGKSCAEIKIDSGHLVMSIYRDGRYLNLPDPGERCQSGDVLIIITEKAYDEAKHW